MYVSRNLIFYLVLGLGLVLLSACNRATPTQSPLLAVPDAPPAPALDTSLAAQGESLYNQYCASCHGMKGEGQPNWQTPKEDGSYPAPPHDNGGHTWHHADGLLIDLIANGVEGFKQSQMPTFDHQLSDEEIRAVLEYVKTWWGPEERSFQWQMTWREQQQ